MAAGESSEGLQFDSDKVAYHLLPVDALDQVARVLTFGARKYGDRNWEKGIKFSRLFRAVLHHIWAWWSGEEVDPESGLHPLAHAACTVLFLLALVLRQKRDFDDRPNGLPLLVDGCRFPAPQTPADLAKRARNTLDTDMDPAFFVGPGSFGQ